MPTPVATTSPPTAEQDDLLLRFLTSPKTRLLRHVLSVGLLLGLLLATNKREYEGLYEYLDLSLFATFLLTLFYLNMYVLIPRTFYRRRSLLYLLYLALTTFVLTGFALLIKKLFFSSHRLVPEDEVSPVLGLVIITLVFLPLFLISTALKLFQRWIADTKRINILENSALQHELKALRSQINPHFLFNMLNSIYVLIRKDADLAAQLTLKLSDFLRYLLYEGNQTTVFLSAELKFITDLLTLEKLRRDSFEFSLDYSKPAVRGVQIPSYILITLVENALKHSQDASNASYVTIVIELEAGMLRFLCTNTVPAVPARPAQPGGLGLANLTRRLELLYPGDFSLTHNALPTQYVVDLTLPL
jgi:sensor histidine kinase YesM